MVALKWFSLKKTRHLTPLLKCVNCEQHPGVVYHYELPLCPRCQKELHKAIEESGRKIEAAIVAISDLPESSHAKDVLARICDGIEQDASHLVKYEDKRLRTMHPEPTEVMHRARLRDVHDLHVTLYLPDETGGTKQ